METLGTILAAVLFTVACLFVVAGFAVGGIATATSLFAAVALALLGRRIVFGVIENA